MLDFVRVFDLLPRIFELPLEVEEVLGMLEIKELTADEYEALLEAVLKAEVRDDVDVVAWLELYHALGETKEKE